MIDNFERGKIMIKGVEIIVIDEEESMIDMGLIKEIESI